MIVLLRPKWCTLYYCPPCFMPYPGSLSKTYRKWFHITHRQWDHNFPKAQMSLVLRSYWKVLLMFCPNVSFTFIWAGEAVTFFPFSDKTGQRNGIKNWDPFWWRRYLPFKRCETSLAPNSSLMWMLFSTLLMVWKSKHGTLTNVSIAIVL